MRIMHSEHARKNGEQGGGYGIYTVYFSKKYVKKFAFYTHFHAFGYLHEKENVLQ